jgi:hypothetical protein
MTLNRLKPRELPLIGVEGPVLMVYGEIAGRAMANFFAQLRRRHIIRVRAEDDLLPCRAKAT